MPCFTFTGLSLSSARSRERRNAHTAFEAEPDRVRYLRSFSIAAVYVPLRNPRC